MERPLVTLEFVVNRGEVFSVNAPGDLTSLTLSGYQSGCDTLSQARGMLNERASVNAMTLTGAARINDYAPEPSGRVTASLRLLPLVAAHGLTLSLTVDGRPMSVLLPFASEDCRWKGGTTYRYVITVSGDRLLVTGMTVTADKK
ncbi:fimbrillin family protein [Alistipes sp.]|uniref:fimbrillin family protein n=1 Tax=Alistipes sp. TaxID=1872444 RepID=UPI003AF4E3DA